MMPYYVFALVDRPPAAGQGRGLGGAVAARRVPGGFALVERRADVPPVELGALKQHDAVVARLAEAVPAILPVRFGTLMEMDEIADALAERDEEIAEAFDRVRGRVQFTWRAGGARSAGASRASGASGAGAHSVRDRGAGAPFAGVGGAEYLRRAARAAKPAAVFGTVRKALKRFVAAERYQPATPSLPDSLYHLVDRTSAGRYEIAAEKILSTSPVLRVSGPFPPFAFAPELL